MTDMQITIRLRRESSVHSPTMLILLEIMRNLVANEIRRSAAIVSPIKRGASGFLICHCEGSSISAVYALQSETETVVARVKALL